MQVQIFMWDYSDPCNTFPTLSIDLVVDSYFLFDVFCQFFIGTFDDSTSFLGDLLLAARRNFTSVGGFWFDLVTSMPWSYLDYNSYLECMHDRSAGGTNSNNRVLRIIKTLRMLKILRLLRAVKVVQVVEDYAVVFFGSALFKILRLWILALFAIHLFCCLFYRVKVSSNEPDTVEAFFLSRNADPTDLQKTYVSC